ncbi:hypothetical protein NDU88_007795 [Pleurodeles waltl]|uniref:Uncharacterized protein n=1 Tax=Pleurodeles waltl TaxID=8319 RepID=A0AAV7NU63_PLEWA|nr:hypothetical protein NDU88_007795 [Pleurodeles waltl]
MFPKSGSGAGFGLGSEMEGSQRERYALGASMWAKAAWSVRCGRRCSFRCRLRGAPGTRGVLPLEGNLFGSQGLGCVKSMEDLLYMTLIRHRPRIGLRGSQATSKLKLENPHNGKTGSLEVDPGTTLTVIPIKNKGKESCPKSVRKGIEREVWAEK